MARTFQDKVVQQVEVFYQSHPVATTTSDMIVSYLLTLRDFHRHKRQPLRKSVEEAMLLVKKDIQ